MMHTPIVLFTYNRPVHTAQTISSLLQNPLAQASELFVFADGAKSDADHTAVQEVHALLKKIVGFKKVHLTIRQENKGLANAVIEGVSEVLAQYPSVIVLEDDMLCATNFLDYMHQALSCYQAQKNIFSISGYNFPIQIPHNYPHDVFICPRPSSWGWATWRDRWQKADWEIPDFQSFIKDKKQRHAFNTGGDDLSIMLLRQQRGEINSWAIRWAYTHFRQGAYCVYPTHSKIQNIGADKTGTHTPATGKYDVVLDNSPYILPPTLCLNNQIQKSFKDFFKRSLIRKTLNWLKYGFTT